jgi:hypothetical protein
MKNNNPKERLIELLGEGHEITRIRGASVVALNSKAILYLRHNVNDGPDDKYQARFWFGITESEYNKYCKSNLFIICVCVVKPDESDYIVLPVGDFEKIRKNIPLQSGQWKFNLFKTYDNKYLLLIRGGGLYDVTEYLNFFDFSPKEFRRTHAPSYLELSVPKSESNAVTPVGESSDLERELVTSARDSANPKRFEVALERFFNEIGFKCKRIGGSGETDVLVNEPFRFIVDGKSTKTNSKSAINFTRIKRHKTQKNSDFMVIVSVGFDQAVGRDAELEGACLIDIQALIEILKVHREYVLSPFDYIEVFKQTGIIDSDKIMEFRNKHTAQSSTIANAITVIENLDFHARTVDEIKGRLDLYCEQKGLKQLEKEEIIRHLSFFSTGALNIIECTNGKYSLRYIPSVARERLKVITGKLSKGAD